MDNCNQEKHNQVIEKVKETVLAQEEVERICKIFHLLSDPNRFKIVQALTYGEMCVYHLLEVCEGTVSAVSHQLRILRDNKIVKSKRCGKNIEYSIADEHIRKMIEMGIEHLDCSSEVLS